MPKNVSGATVDVVHKGQAYGSLATRLLQSGFNANALRTNDTLRKEEWIELDRTVVQIARQRLRGIADLTGRGLVMNVANGLGTTVIQWEDISDMTPAEITMDGANRAQNDRVEYDLKSLPLPIIHKDFQMSARVLESSRRFGTPLDTTQAAIAARKVSDKLESMLFMGASSYAFGGGTIYGYTDHPNRNTASGTLADWTTTYDGEKCLADVIELKAALIADNHFGPYILYLPTSLETTIDKDFKAASDKTLRQRILEVGGIEDVRIADSLTGNNILLVELQQETVRLVIGMQPTNIEWQIEGGMILHYKTMLIMVPNLRTDQELRMGVVHMTLS